MQKVLVAVVWVILLISAVALGTAALISRLWDPWLVVWAFGFALLGVLLPTLDRVALRVRSRRTQQASVLRMPNGMIVLGVLLLWASLGVLGMALLR